MGNILKVLSTNRPSLSDPRDPFVHAPLDREKRAADQTVVKARRVHRMMGNNAMLPEKHTSMRKSCIHDGKIRGMHSNPHDRWNGDIGCVASIIDTFARKPRAQCLNVHWFPTLADWREKLDTWLRFGNEDRPYSAIGYSVPMP